MLLAVGRQRRGQQVDLRDLVALDDGGEAGGVGDVELLVRQARVAAGRGDVAGDDLGHARALRQRAGEFGADLAVGADDEDARARSWLRSDQAQLLAGLRERLDRLLEVVAIVHRAHLHADARLALRHDREEEADRVDAQLQDALASAAAP